ncbi:TM2 domain-containing protein [Serratia marcescens]|uniref:TM2 domain-containing protein n=1 Tax=Serratia marcescens TaxID=615 RepID=UPI0013DCE371|nr:TM2 domain-containing protein [Serratia marcescens]CAI1966948.1 Tfp pilus assembly protein, major pilin PilA [Serratia marcescens]
MSGMVFCRGCGKEIHSSAQACPHCGALQSVPQGKRNKMSAILLTLFLGGFGGHKFYLGKPGQGILYLIFFWTFIPAFIAFIELIMLICMSDDEFNRKYNS